jgi:hypothetical protein
MFGETAVEKEQHSELQQEEDPVVENETNNKELSKQRPSTFNIVYPPSVFKKNLTIPLNDRKPYI